MCLCPCPCPRIRTVPPFSYRTFQCCTRTPPGPPRLPVFRRKRCPCRSQFRMYFLRGDIPICRNYAQAGGRPRKFIQWQVPPEKLDFQRYLPLFFEGLCETTFPYREFARNGVRDMISKAREKQPSISSDHDGEHVVAQSNVLFVPHTLVHTHHQILSSVCAVVFREPLTHHQTTLSTSQGTSSSPEPSSYDTGRISLSQPVRDPDFYYLDVSAIGHSIFTGSTT
ncbi:conserved hypothetical protein [Culex quinquefasciatus]|uniref:Uncharacterized protein n=1 Tax=Culex quinquefasciatus TaxID=7176 RepID=B0XDB6_CULQU|nr:conserved hypothetical protein [Culex quinquefasciatus]|eukprot:XP_001867637.1 conserved hypothetical protein [Culex quinquefasciatus]